MQICAIPLVAHLIHSYEDQIEPIAESKHIKVHNLCINLHSSFYYNISVFKKQLSSF